ncbi:EpsG family protein [Mariprofundus sp. NF]|uniref:EpsG family protein n=1 Tax=Mariprofundus sp. NF TaxID=2608716 RepID=UPI0015A1D1F5|nr:EpsG family protein [Mariprofundus sp. NF]
MLSLPLLAVFSPVKTEKDLSFFAILSFGVLAVFFIGTRHEVGGDWYSYLHHYELVINASFIDAMKSSDPGYAFLNWWMAELDFGIYGVNLVCGAIFMAGLITFSRTMPLPWLAILVAVPYLYTVVAMGYSRQAVAIGFELLALCALVRLATVKFFLFVFCAALFHKTAVLLALLGVFFSPNSRLSPLRIVTGILVAAFVMVMFLQDYYETLLLNYVERTMHSDGGQIRVLMNALPGLIFLLLYRQWIRRFGKQQPWLVFALASLACIPLVSLASTAVDRIALYLLPIQLYVWSHFPLIFRNPMYRYAALLAIVGVYVAVLWVWLNFGNQAQTWLPYQSVFFL